MPPPKKRRHNSRRYRSGLEKEVAAYLTAEQKQVRYEVLKIEWEDLRYRTYTPDFVLDNGIIIETKGIFDSDDRRKHLEVRKQHPELDIRFVFSNAKAKLYKGAKSRYFDWCDKNAFMWAHRVIPEAWLKEKGKPIKVDRIALKHKRKT
ncbi:MAG: endonuclease I [Phycisphaerae bacterium]|nr:endonuclease I [Phycisphaerae bacterium]